MAACALAFAPCYADTPIDEEAQIVTTCHFGNMEWGTDMIDICVKENRTLRADVLAYPEQHQRLVTRCRAKAEFGWAYVKKCVDQDIEAQAALAQYPSEKAELVALCTKQFAPHGAVKVKSCVDEAGDPPQEN